MNIALISDLHLLAKTPEERCDNILEKQWDKLEYVLKYCEDHKIYHLFQAGDFFDVPRNWETFNRTVDILQKYRSVKIYCVEGQHDRYMRNEDSITNLSLLHRLGLVTILKNSISFGQFDVHGVSFEDSMNIDKTLDAIELTPARFNLLVIHAPISDTALFPGHEFSKAGLLLKKHKNLDLILCGDIHKEFVVFSKDRAIVNTGSMIRKARNNYNEIHRPMFYTVETGDNVIKSHVIPYEPFWEVFAQQEKIVESDILSDFVEAIEHPVSDEMDVFKRIERFITDNNIDEGVSRWIGEVSNE